MADYKNEIKELLQTLVSTKADIKAALIKKGVTPEGGEVTYADAIDKISGGSNVNCDMIFPEDVVAVKVQVGENDVTDSAVNGGTMLIEEAAQDIHIKVSEIKSVTYILEHMVSSNMGDRIPISYEYSTTITPNYGYEWDRVIIMMNNVNVTDSVFDPETGEINIDSVTGDIVISVTGKLKTYNVNNNLTESVNSNSATKITHGDAYTAVITPNTHYALTKVYVEMDGTILYDESWDELDEVSSFNINIPQAIEDITIVVESKVVIVVTSVLDDVTSNNSQTKYRYGESYEATLTTSQYYDFVDKSCNDATASFSAVALDEVNRTRSTVITIPTLTKDVVVNASADRVAYTITNTLVETTNSNSAASIQEGETYNAILTPTQYFEFKTYSITMGSEDVTSLFNTDNGQINIDKVIGDIVINIESTRIVVNVINNLTGITTNNDATTALMGLDYSELLTIDYSQYDDINITVTMNGEEIDYHNMTNGEINIPLVLGDIIVTAKGITESLSQYNTLDHYTFDEIAELSDGQSVDVIMASPRIDHGYVIGYDGAEMKNFGNGYKNLVRMQHEIAPISTDNQYIMSLYKRQDTKMEDIYGEVTKTFNVSGSFYNSTITKLSSNIAGYDLYGCTNSFSNGNATRTGTVTVRFSGKQVPRTIYLKAYSSRGDNTNYHCYINYNSSIVCRGTNNQTLTSLSNFTAYDINSTEITFAIEGKNNSTWTGNNVNVWFLVPNNITEIEVTGQQEVPDGLPYFALTTKLGNKSLTKPDDLRATPEGFNVLEVEHITSPNQTYGLLADNNPCVFKFSRIADGQLLSSGAEIGPLGFEASENDRTVWYLYKPNTAGYSTSNVTITNRLTNATTSNSANSVAYGGSYSTQVAWDASRTPYRLSVTMCGHDITQSAFNADSRQINIPCVIGPVVVTVACVDVDDMKKVTYTLIDVAGMTGKTGYSESMSTDDFDAVLEGDKYTAKPTFQGLATLSERNFNMSIQPSQYQYMKITECYAEMGGQRYDNIYNEATNTITIQEITDDCHITVKALYVVGYVDDTYYDSDLSSNHIFVETNALGSGAYTAKYSGIGETKDGYNDITSFNI